MTCAHCGMKVLSSKDGRCPGCRKLLAEAPDPDAERKRAAARAEGERQAQEHASRMRNASQTSPWFITFVGVISLFASVAMSIQTSDDKSVRLWYGLFIAGLLATTGGIAAIVASYVRRT
jgi:hypothetical protein